MKYFSMFSGIGGFELGIRNKGECVGYSEIDKYAIKIYEKHFKHKSYGDTTGIIPEEIEDFDLLCGGFPCQAFSIAGKRGGFDDTRGTLFFEIARILAVKRPSLLLLENVKGLLSHDNGNTFGTILTTLSDLGYFLEWQVLNSKDFGVPQNRERLFIVGHLGGECGQTVLPIKDGCERLVEASPKGEFRQEDCASALKARDYKDGTTHVCLPVLTPDREEKRQNGRRFKENGDPSFTLTAQDQHGIYDGHMIRRLTPTECERLQGFPDGWTEGVSDKQRYKCLGNAVTVNVIENISKKLLDTIA